MEVLSKAKDLFKLYHHHLSHEHAKISIPNDSEIERIVSDPIDVQTLKQNLGGNHILIDFSTAGFRADDRIPLQIQTNTQSILISKETDDDTKQLQDAINAAPSGHKLRLQGKFTLKGSIEMRRSNFHLEGPADIYVDGPRRTVFQVTGGGNAPKFNAAKQSRIIDAYVPVGATKFSVAHPAIFKVGDQIVIQRQITDEWIKRMGMDSLSRNGQKQIWLDSKAVMKMDRIVTAVHGNTVHVDASIPEPLMAQIDGQALVYVYTFPGRIQQVAIENLNVVASESARPSTFLAFHSVQDCYVKDVRTTNFDSQITLGSSVKRTTVSNCKFVHHNDNTQQRALPAEIELRGSQLLVKDCVTEGAKFQTFVALTQSKTSGPNVILRYVADSHRHIISPHQRWAVGLLVDNCRVGNVSLSNRGGKTHF